MSANNGSTHRLERDFCCGRGLRSFQRFSKIEASDNSTIQNGNNTYFITHNYFWKPDTTSLSASRQHKSQPSLDAALACLNEYATGAQTQKTGTDSKSIGAQLAVILNTIAQTEYGDLHPREMNERIENLRKQLQQPRSISINTPCARQRVVQFSRAESKMLSVILEHWQISLTTKTVKTVKPGRVEDQADIQTCSALHVRRLRSGEGTHIAAFCNEESSIERDTWFPPILLAYRHLRKTDRIFKLVANDDLRSLNELLRKGEACLRDCDEDGRSLLFYASLYASVKVCKFLVDSGAEVDRFHYDHHRTSHQTTALLAFRHTDQTTRESLDRAQICRKVLLQAGADPTISHAESDIRSALLESIQGNVDCSGSNEFYELLISEGSTFIDTRKVQSAWSSVIVPDLY